MKMSMEYPCVYFEKDGKCRKFSDDYRFVSYCVMGPCPEQKLSNADRIRAMTDEELAKLLLDGCRGSKCDSQPQNEYGSVNCFECRMKWLQQPEEEDT